MSWITFLVAVAALIVAARKSSRLEDLERLAARLEREIDSIRRALDSSEAEPRAEQRPVFGSAPIRQKPEPSAPIFDEPSPWWTGPQPRTATTPAVEPARPDAPISDITTAEERAPEPVEPAAPIEVTPAKPAEIPSESFASIADDPQPAESPAAEPFEPAAAESPVPATFSPRKVDFEFRLGGRIYGWLGGIALALAGVFLVKYSLDQQLLSPTVRIVLGALFGVGLLAGGQWMGRRSNNLGQALSAAGVGDLYAVLFASVALYDLLPSAVAFTLLAVLTGFAIWLSLRQGQFVALVGLAGGFLTPAIVSTGEPKPAILFAYLFLIHLGTQFLLQRRGWWQQAVLGAGGGLVWALLVTLVSWPDAAGSRVGAIWLPLFLIATHWTALWSLLARGDGIALHQRQMAAFGVTAVCHGLMLLWLAMGGFAMVDWGFAIVLGLSHLAAARKYDGQEEPAGIGLLLGLAAFGLWRLGALLTGLVPDTGTLIASALVYGAALLAGGAWFVLGSVRPVRWAAVSCAGPALIFISVYWNLHGSYGLTVWTLATLVMAALHAGLAFHLNAPRLAEPRYREAFALHCLFAAGYVAAAIPLAISRDWLSIGWAIELPLIAYMAGRFDIPWLRKSVAAGAALVIAGVALSGVPMDGPPIVNWLLYGLGIPCVSFAATAWLLRRHGDDNLVFALELGAAGLLFMLVTLEVNQSFAPAGFAQGAAADLAAAIKIIIWLAVALVLCRAYQRSPRQALLWAAWGFIAVGALLFVVIPILFANPFAAADGSLPIFNRQLIVYGLPALGFFLVARELETQAPIQRAKLLPVWGTVGLAVLGVLLLVFQQVRHTLGYFASFDSGTTFVMAGVESVIWLAIAIALHWRNAKAPRASTEIAAWGFTAAALVRLVAGPILIDNPLLTPIALGDWPIVNRLLLVYGVPAALLFGLAELLRRWDAPQRAGDWPARAVVAVGQACFFLFVTLEIWHFFPHAGITDSGVPLLRTAAQVTVWALVGSFLHRRNRADPRPSRTLSALGYTAAAVLGSVVGLFLLFNPLLSDVFLGSWPILNRLLFAYGVTAAALIVLGRTVEGQDFFGYSGAPVTFAVKLIAQVALFLLVTTEAGQFVDWLGIRDSGTLLVKYGAAVAVWLAVALSADQLVRRRDDQRALAYAWGYATLAAIAFVAGPMLLENPFLNRVFVGSMPVFNRLLIVYLLPCVMFAAIALRLGACPYLKQRQSWPAAGFALLSLTAGFGWLTALVRQIFQGPILAGGFTDDAELYTYSVVWLGYGLALLGIGVWQRSQAIRYASAAVVLLTVCKVFLLDAAGLTGLYRVASFLGLGFSLIAIGYLYQRLLPRRGPVAEGTTTT
ncbi:MAG TPA: DUF2339 domain-containing protein [Dongiaceae bacterium]|nr:DUF2339 domain-containing protein [Dongiaceae bacterium]